MDVFIQTAAHTRSNTLKAAPLEPPLSGRSVFERVRERLRAASRRLHAPEPDDLFCKAHADPLRPLHSVETHANESPDSRHKRESVAPVSIDESPAGPTTQMDDTKTSNIAHIDDLIVAGPLTVGSTCAHHLCPVTGPLWIGVLAQGDAESASLSRYASLADSVMRKPQTQEEALNQLADLLVEHLHLAGVALIMQADHQCMQWRGMTEHETHITSVVMRGAFLHQPALRTQFLMVIVA